MSTTEVLSIVVLVVASISLLADLLTVALIVDMGKRTGFLMLVMSLSMSQLLYDIGFFFRNSAEITPNSPAYGFYTFAYIFTQIFGGIATTLITNAIAFIVAIIAFTLRSYDIAANLKYIAAWIFILAFVPAVIAGILHFSGAGLWLYPYYYYISLRAVSILVNIVLCGMLVVRLNSMGIYIFSGHSNDSVHPIAALSSRMILYPIIQVLTRLGAIWMELGYPEGTVTDDNQEIRDDPNYLIALTLFSIFGPAAGIGFFVVFIFMQPKALMHLYRRLQCASTGKCLEGGIIDIDEEGGTERDMPSTSSDLKTDLLRAGPSGAQDRGGDGDSSGLIGGDDVHMSDVSLDSNDPNDNRHHSRLGDMLRLGGGEGSGGNVLSRENSRHSNPVVIGGNGGSSTHTSQSRRSRDFALRSNPTTGGLDISHNSYSGNERFLRGNLDHLDDEQLAQLVDRLAESEEDRLDEVPDSELMQEISSSHSDSYANSPSSMGYRAERRG
jgi:hypothetical protein